MTSSDLLPTDLSQMNRSQSRLSSSDGCPKSASLPFPYGFCSKMPVLLASGWLRSGLRERSCPAVPNFFGYYQRSCCQVRWLLYRYQAFLLLVGHALLDSNQRPLVLETNALPTKLSALPSWSSFDDKRIFSKKQCGGQPT